LKFRIKDYTGKWEKCHSFFEGWVLSLDTDEGLSIPYNKENENLSDNDKRYLAIKNDRIRKKNNRKNRIKIGNFKEFKFPIINNGSGISVDDIVGIDPKEDIND
jgi:hypothetical protein